ncbi:hypothetical protein WJ60_19405 [Burkholderia ubonensis]|uniref:hypothetical protein n=1 Tax=Burkholderia ubonensis TaxID=101571 RepID=UPI00076C06EC|nr:hypothetical protein [Burkholderia ubonensis]KVM60344.1 hypothetical protein WJ60_19405 [Burkholderia ubonensis]
MRKGLLATSSIVLVVAVLFVLWHIYRQRSAPFTLVACEGQTVSVWSGDHPRSRTLVYSLSPLDGSALFRYLDADRNVVAMREIRLDQKETKMSTDRVEMSGVVGCMEGPGDIPSNDPFLLEVQKGRRISIALRRRIGNIWAVQLGAVNLGYCTMRQ